MVWIPLACTLSEGEIVIPNFDLWLGQAWGWGDEVIGNFAAASNIVVGTNPPYGLLDFLTLYPKFAGAPTAVTGIESPGSAVLTGITSTAGMSAGQLVTGVGLPANTVIQTVDSGTQITLSQPATGSGAVSLAAYTSPLLPVAVINVYIALASASIIQRRWCDAWLVGMGLFVAHYCTLWLQSDGNVGSSPGQAAAAGLAQGIKTSKSAGPLSVGMMPAPGLEAWGAWNLTAYGVQLASMARLIGGGPMLIW